MFAVVLLLSSGMNTKGQERQKTEMRTFLFFLFLSFLFFTAKECIFIHPSVFGGLICRRVIELSREQLFRGRKTKEFTLNMQRWGSKELLLLIRSTFYFFLHFKNQLRCL